MFITVKTLTGKSVPIDVDVSYETVLDVKNKVNLTNLNFGWKFHSPIFHLINRYRTEKAYQLTSNVYFMQEKFSTIIHRLPHCN